MSYSFRNRPKLSDRYRGKSGDEILNELKNQLDEDTKMFFESSPAGWNSVQSPSSFTRAGNPLDDMMSRGRQDIRSHLDDLAQRHPEFADHLRCPPWGGEMGSTSGGTWGRKRCGSGSSGDDPTLSEQMLHNSDEPSPSRGRARQNNLPQHGLRNTVDLGQQQQQQMSEDDKCRGQRSWSAPPDNRSQNPADQQRFVSRLDIPINTTPTAVSPDQGKPPVAPKQQHQSTPPNVQQQHPSSVGSKLNQQSGNVRHIPIFVEGRDEPLLPKAEPATEKIFTERVAPQPTFSYGRPSQFTARQTQQHPPQQTFAQNESPVKVKTSVHQQQAPSHHQAPPPTPQQKPQQEPSQPKPAQQPPRPPANDPISRVQAVQKEVDELKKRVESYSGISRKDKEYIYLDEMLTRNLLQLDNIETEGKDDVRQARKAVIRNIQQCISLLETKVPSPEESCSTNSEDLNCADETKQSMQDSVKVSNDQHQSSGENTACEQDKESQGDLRMEVENLLSVEEKKEETPKVPDSKSELSMEADPIHNLNKHSSEVNLESEKQEVQTLGKSAASVADASASDVPTPVPAEQSNSIVKDNLQQTEMQVDEPREQMEVDSFSRKDSLPVPGENTGDESKSSNESTKDVSVKPQNKTRSPKGSPKSTPKKGKRAT